MRIVDRPFFAAGRAGLIGAAAMYAMFLAVRFLAGVATPSEMFADVSAPFISVPIFGVMIGLAGGYTPLKIIGFTSVIAGALIVGIIGGLVAQRSRNPARFLWLLAAALFGVTLIVFSPVLQTNYYGIPPGSARLVTAFVLACGYALYAFVTSRLLRLDAVEPDRSRRRFLAGSIAGGVVILGFGSWAELFRRSAFPYDGKTVKGPGVGVVTPNDKFYCVTKNVTDPSIDRDLWRLTIGGAVGQRLSYDFAQFSALPSIDQETTLMCINNDVDGGLMSNALWHGVTLPSLLALAQPSSDVKRVAFHCADNFIETIPLAKAMEPTTMIAYLMNGEPLPARHGFPARVLVPGFFGERNPKWLVGITLETTELEGFYERQGWGPNMVIPTHARFDAPDFGQPLQRGTIALSGVAFAGNRGVKRVEVSTDGGARWNDATLTSPYVPTAWRLWRYDWQAMMSGTFKLSVRATDAHGNVQVSMRRPTAPQGATGLDQVEAHVA